MCHYRRCYPGRPGAVLVDEHLKGRGIPALHPFDGDMFVHGHSVGSPVASSLYVLSGLQRLAEAGGNNGQPVAARGYDRPSASPWRTPPHPGRACPRIRPSPLKSDTREPLPFAEV